MQPHKEKAAELRQDVIPLKEQLKVFKKEKKAKRKLKS
jgi:type I restriction enzyme M protein